MKNCAVDALAAASKAFWILCVSLSFVTLPGCGKKFDFGGSPGETKVEYYMVDGVKNLRSDVQDGADPRSFREDQYLISPTSRLLLRFESLSSQASKIVISDSDDVWIRVIVAEGQSLELAQQQLKVCPVSKNWMMLATWKFAHPFGTSGFWRVEGGDYEGSGCVQAQFDPGKNPTVGVTPMDQRALYFRITRWYQDLVRGKNENRGHILMSEGSEVLVIGDNSASFGPRIQWSEIAF